MTELHGLEVAVIGLSGRFPGANNIDDFWTLLKNGSTGISSISDDDLMDAGVSYELLHDSNYVKKKGLISGKELFDAQLFGYTTREAEILDPQFCVFHECVWDALENAGYNSQSYAGLVGIYAGATNNIAWLNRILKTQEALSDQFSTLCLTSANLLSSRIAYVFDLKGPAIYVQTACSTSLVAVHLACQGLISGECDMALAGAVSILELENKGYLYQEGMINSPDGVCRSFDADANGTVFSDGCGVVVLKLLENALEDRDNVIAVIKGSAINNDGSQKVGYTAPGVEGQLQVIKLAHAKAEVTPESISYVEAHGTATKLGDPIEIQALKFAFESKEKSFCRVGSVKTNIGHLDAAAGIAGLIKTVLALKNKQLPPSLHFKKTNPHIDFENGPFTINTVLCDWEKNNYPRRAGVSSFGIGGTNAHIVLEESCFEIEGSETKRVQAVCFSANSKTALKRIEDNLLDYIDNNKDISLPDICYTLHVGRRALTHRKAFVIENIDNFRERGIKENNSITYTGSLTTAADKKICFLLPGLKIGKSIVKKDLYCSEPDFRRYMDECFEIVKECISVDLKPYLLSEDASEKYHASMKGVELDELWLFMLEYSLAKVLIDWGFKSSMMIGYGVGEYVAACLSGVFTLKDALLLIYQYGNLMKSISQGATLCVTAEESRIQSIVSVSNLKDRVSIVVVAANLSDRVVVSGDKEAVSLLKESLDKQEVIFELVHPRESLNSACIGSNLSDYKSILYSVKFNSPTVPFISNMSGELVSSDSVISPSYWLQSSHHPMQFMKGVALFCNREEYAFLEVGPGKELNSLVMANTHGQPDMVNVSMLGKTEKPGSVSLMNGICELFISGFSPDWEAFYHSEQRKRVPLPSYPFEGKNHYSELKPITNINNDEMEFDFKRENIDEWYYVPVWELSSQSELPLLEKGTSFLIFMDDYNVGEKLANQVQNIGGTFIRVYKGDEYIKKDPRKYIINPFIKKHFDKLILDLQKNKRIPSIIIHLWGVGSDFEYEPDEASTVEIIKLGYYTQIYLVQALGLVKNDKNITLKICANSTLKTCTYDNNVPEKAINVSPSKVIPFEYSFLKCQFVDFVTHEFLSCNVKSTYDFLTRDILSEKIKDNLVAYRKGRRYVQTYKKIELIEKQSSKTLFKENGNYLITGGLGGLGLAFAEHLAKSLKGTLLLLIRSPFLSREKWNDWLKTHSYDDDTVKKIDKIKAIEKLGVKIVIASVDVSNAKKLRDVLITFIEQEGKINGVIHAAGIPSQGAMQLKTDYDIEKALSAKVNGTKNLKSILPSEDLDFMIMFSSQAALTGGIGEVDYCAGNMYLDAFAQHYDSFNKTRYISINWPAWKDTGMAVNTKMTEATRKNRNKELKKIAISTVDGVTSFDRILSDGMFSQVVVSPYSVMDFVKILYSTSHAVDNAQLTVNVAHLKHNLDNSLQLQQADIEEKLIELWKQMIGLDQINIDDNLFNIGADSLLYIRANNRIKGTFGVELRIENMLSFTTIKEQSIEIYKICNNVQDVGIPIVRTNQKIAPMSIQQKSRWILIKESNKKAFHNIPSAFILDGPLCVDSLERAFNDIVERHSSIRTVFFERNGNAFQRILEEVKFQIKKMDLSMLSIQEKEKQINVISDEDIVAPFDLQRDLMLRAKIIKYSVDKHVLLINHHHIAFDWWSMGILLSELSEFYCAYVKGEEVSLPPIPIQYIDFSLWQRALLQGDYLDKKLNYWNDVIKGKTKKIGMSKENLNNISSEYNGACYSALVDNLAIENLGKLAEEYDTSLFVILQTTLVIMVYKLTNNTDIKIGFNAANRMQEIVEQLIGLFSSSLVFRSDLSNNLCLSDLIIQTKENILSAIANQHASLDLLIENSNGEMEEILRNATSNFVLTFRGKRSEGLVLPGLRVSLMSQRKVYAGPRVFLEVTEIEKGLEIVWHYNCDVYTIETIKGFSEMYCRLLCYISKEKHLGVRELVSTML